MSDPKKPDPIHARLIGVRFTTPVQFAGTTDSLRIGANCLSIAPARLEPDGSAVATDKGQASQGILCRAQGRGFVSQTFVPFANVSEVLYGP
jgi:hypothetical protein